jgi:hypothetical protein
LDAIGSGYNIYEGNPLFSTGIDEGMKLSGNVFDITYSQNRTTEDGKYLIPDQVESGELKGCYGESDEYSFTGMDGYFHASSDSVISGSFIPKTSFSLSRKYKETENLFASNNK